MIKFGFHLSRMYSLFGKNQTLGLNINIKFPNLYLQLNNLDVSINLIGQAGERNVSHYN